ncbi:hypothetical protein FGO68_gene11547 [Halteria grandinella]|uniref:Uncharacterized protein n=1 Tax=Halteria grandinella TaxID=5974 RepID=A0A8J8TBA3_HALGN|nr:hypothetical protein FGO68_gene11547 [Halteria grandinella]
MQRAQLGEAHLCPQEGTQNIYSSSLICCSPPHSLHIRFLNNLHHKHQVGYSQVDSCQDMLHHSYNLSYYHCTLNFSNTLLWGIVDFHRGIPLSQNLCNLYKVLTWQELQADMCLRCNSGIFHFVASPHLPSIGANLRLSRNQMLSQSELKWKLRSRIYLMINYLQMSQCCLVPFN